MTDWRVENKNLRRKRLVWVSFLILDTFLHKTSRIEILRHLAKRGYTVYLIAVRSRRKYELGNSNIHIISIPLRYVPAISPIIFVGMLLIFLPCYIIYLNPDFIVTEPDISIFGFIWASLLSPFRGFKLALDIRSTPVETVGLRGYLNTFVFNISVFFAKGFFDGMTIITIPMRKEICDKFDIDSRFVGVWTSGVSLTLFNPKKYDEEAMKLRRKIGLTDKFIVFYHGNFGVERRTTEFIKSMEILRSKYPDLVFFLLGSGPALPEMKNIIQKGRIQDRVIIHNPVDYTDVPKYVAMCDIGIVPLPDLPDWRHQCPLKLLEYLSMEKAAIVTDIPAHREVIGNSKCGVYVSSANAKEIARAIAYAYNNKEKMKRFGSYGRAIIRRKYTWNKAAEDFDNYLSALKSG